MIFEKGKTLADYAVMLFRINESLRSGAINDAEAGRMMEEVIENLENYLPEMKHTVELLKKSRL